jgi:hypothetical protein
LIERAPSDQPAECLGCAGDRCVRVKPVQAVHLRAGKPNDYPMALKEYNRMSKGMDRKREPKKKPAKTMLEKRAAEHAKRANKGFQMPERNVA